MTRVSIICVVLVTLVGCATKNSYTVEFNNLEMAKKYEARGSYKLAEKYYKSHLASDSADCSAYAAYLRFLQNRERSDEGRLLIDEIRTECEESTEIGIIEAELLLSVDDLRAAYQRLMPLPEDNPTVLKLFGRLFMQMENYDEAKAYFERSLDLDPLQKDVVGYLDYLSSIGN